MSIDKKCVCRTCGQTLFVKANVVGGRIHCPKCGIWNRVHASRNIDIPKPFINIKNIFLNDLSRIKNHGFIYLFKKNLLSELSCLRKNLLSINKNCFFCLTYFISSVKKFNSSKLGDALAGGIFVLIGVSSLACIGWIGYDIYQNDSDLGLGELNNTPENILAVKESPSNPTVGIISNSKGKPGYLYVPGKKSYEVTYEEDGILKTKTMSSDPTK